MSEPYSITSVAPTSDVCVLHKIKIWDGIWWHNVHIKFIGIPTIHIAFVTNYRHTHTCIYMSVMSE
jgi:hypothetical protein